MEWDTQMRPLPAGARTLSLDHALASDRQYDCVINHNITDLLDTRSIAAPKLLVLHETLEGRMQQQGAEFEAPQMRVLLNSYLATVGGYAIAISRTKAKSWGVTHTVVQNSVDPDAYLPHVGDLASGIRVANHITSKRDFLAWDFHQEALSGIPVRIVGHNPDMPSVQAATDWNHLKRMLASHRFMVHTADPRYEDGYNMAVLEGMAAGLPVLTNSHPTTLVQHGTSGFVAATPADMRQHAQLLLDDEALAQRMGEAAREQVQRSHGPDRFRVELTRAVREAKKKWARRSANPTAAKR